MRASLLATALALGLATPTVGRAQTRPIASANVLAQVDRPVRLIVDAQALGGDAKRTTEAIETKAAAAMAQHGLRPDPDATLELRVVVRFLDEDRRDYITALELHEAGKALEPGLTPFECLTCVTADLAERVAAQIPDAAKLIEAAGTESTPSTTPETAAEPSHPQTTSPAEAELHPKKASLGPLGIVGIVGILGGTAGVIAGSVLLAKGEETKQVGMGEIEVVDHRPAGYAALGVGLGVFALGAVFIAVDQTVLEKRRNEKVTWTPVLDRRMVGVQFLRRF